MDSTNGILAVYSFRHCTKLTQLRAVPSPATTTTIRTKYIMPPRRTPRTTAGKSTPKSKTSSKSAQATPIPTADNAPETPTRPTTAAAEPPSSLPNTDHFSEESQPAIVSFEANPHGGAATTIRTLNEASLAEKPPRRTVVRRTVRVVRKIVKKKVGKNSEIGTSVSYDGEVEKLEFGNDVRPNPSSLPDVELNHLDSVDISKPDYTVCAEIEHSEPIVTVSVDPEYQSPDPSGVLSIEAAKHSDFSMGTENQKELGVGEGGKDGCFEQISKVALDGVAANTGSDEVEDFFQANTDLLDDHDEILAGYQKDEGITGSANSEGSKGKVEGVMEMEQLVKKSECSELRIDGGETEDVEDASNECDDRRKEQARTGEIGSEVEVGLGDGVLLNEEMEAMERKRRRKTEIFIGGLGKEVKEVDITKVFEVVGEIADVTVVKDGKTGKGKGFAFVRYASADDAKTALAKYHKVEICGRQCGTSPVEGNDTIFLGNINKKWKNEDVLKHLQEIGIEKIDRVTVKTDPKNLELNRGFAFLEFETKKDAQTAFHKLQKKDLFGRHSNIKIEWAEPLIEPDEEEILKVKSVYAEYIPSSWDEEKVKDYFKCFGEIENVTLARNLRSSKRNDFAFINYKTREAALACMEGFSRERHDEGSKVNVKVSLAKSVPRGKQTQHVSRPPSMEIPKGKQNAAVVVLAPHELRNMGKSTTAGYKDTRADGKSSTLFELRNMGNSTGTRYKDTRADGQSSSNAELLQLLREQASWKPTTASSSLAAGFIKQDYLHPTPGWKRSSDVLGTEFHSDLRGNPRMRLESSYPIANPSSRPLQGVGNASLPGYKQYGSNYPSEAFYRVEEDPTYTQTRERAPYHDSSALYRRY